MRKFTFDPNTGQPDRELTQDELDQMYSYVIAESFRRISEGHFCFGSEPHPKASNTGNTVTVPALDSFGKPI